MTYLPLGICTLLLGLTFWTSAQAIKEEIFNLTHAAAHNQRHISHAGAASFGSASDDEGPQGRGHALSEGGLTVTSEAYGQESAATYLKFDVGTPLLLC